MKCEICGGNLNKVRDNDRSLLAPASRYMFVCDKDNSHMFEDPNSMPVDRSKSITD